MKPKTGAVERVTGLGAAGACSEAEILAEAVAELQRLDAGGLQRRWRSLVGRPLPPDLGRPLTLRILTYKLQAQRLGDLDRASLRELVSLPGSMCNAERTRASDQSAMLAAEASEAAAARPAGSAPARIARPGTLLVREHSGILHRVMVLDEGVTWNDKTYDSLTKVAFAITGTRWNGPRFFGLRASAKAESGRPKRRSPIAADKAAVGHTKQGRGPGSRTVRSSPQGTSP